MLDLILNLALKTIWYRKIESGEKRNEYREIKPYWMNRLVPVVNGEKKRWTEEECELIARGAIGIPDDAWKPYKTVVFSLGYTKTRMAYNIVSFSIDTSCENDLGKPAIRIELGNKI